MIYTPKSKYPQIYPHILISDEISGKIMLLERISKKYFLK